jgi:uncharacterized protein YndB with AHSA1/START domain
MPGNLIKERVVNAPRTEVWRAFTTTEDLKSFFAPDAYTELRLEGPYELYFLSDAEPGFRGSEGCKVLSFLEEEMLSLTWNAPPQFPEERGQHTFVVVQFYDEDEGKTRVKLTHAGWKNGGRWAEVYDYFDDAWEKVLDWLEERYSDLSPAAQR